MKEGKPPKRQTSRRGDETRLRLLKAAREQFAQQGYDGSALRMIASSAGITLALLHYHFGSKQELYRAVWVEQYTSAEELERRSAYTTVPTREKREEALRAVIRAAISGPIQLMQDKRGGEFITILARELADPKAAERGLLDEFISPVGVETQHALRAIMPELSEDRFQVGLLMTVAASQQLIHYSTLAGIGLDVQPATTLPASAPRIVDFIVAGWQTLLRDEEGS